MPDLDKITELLRSGRSPADIQRILLPEPWQQAVRVCATAGPVDDELYATVLSRHCVAEPLPQLDQLVERGLLEPADDTDVWQVPRAQITGWMNDWQVGWSEQGTPPALAALETDLAGWHAEQGDPDEQLRHLLAADPQAAIDLFDREFTLADEHRDFARCQDLLNVLEDTHRITYAGSEVAELRLNRAGYLRARLYWSTSFSRSAQFLVPDGLVERVEALLGEGPRVWQLYAPTGTGKTMQLQWMVARRCVPADYDICCARIDFDTVDPVNAARHPWLLLLEIADQLERRWPRRAFERLDRYASYRSLLERRATDVSHATAHGIAAQDTFDLDRRISSVFIRRFNEAAGDQPVVLVIDTMEEVLLSGGTDALLALLARLVKQCPQLRLILSGRYDLRERAGPALAAFGAVESIAVEDFSAKQTTRYLREIRGIPDREMCAAIWERTAGHPLLVSMFADLIIEEPGTTPAELREYRDPALRLLIDRVIRRIPEADVRWLVRYGVVPRRLHVGDVATVMAPFLTRGRSGPDEFDDPRVDRHHLEGSADIFPFGTAPTGDDEYATLWRRLLEYAGPRSWVSEPDGDGRTVAFHQKVRAPMRDLIGAQPVARELHEAFRQRYDDLATAHADAPARFLRESLYHRIQLGDPAAVDFWRVQIRARRNARDLDGLAELAADLLGDDYVDPGGEPLTPLLSPEVLAEASVWLAFVAVERARGARAAGTDPMWTEAEQHLDRSGSVGPRTLTLALRAAVRFAAGDVDQAIELIETAAQDPEGDARVDLLRIFGEVLAVTAPAEASRLLEDAYNTAAADGRHDQQEPLGLTLARQWAADGRLERAATWCHLLAERDGSRAARHLEAELLLTMFRPQAALDALGAEEPRTAVERVERHLLTARAHALIGAADRALDETNSALNAAGSISPPASFAHLAGIYEVRGDLLAELLELEDAERDLTHAASLWADVGFADGHPGCALRHFRFLVRDVGDLRKAARLRMPPAGPNDPVRLRWRDLTLEVAENAELEPDTPAEPDLHGQYPHLIAESIASRLALSWDDHRHLLGDLIDALRQIDSVTGRRVVLAELRRCTQQVPYADVELLRPMLVWPGGLDQLALDQAREHPADAAVNDLLMVELERLSGNHDRAAELLVEVTKQPSTASMELLQWRWLQAANRVGRSPVDPWIWFETAPRRPLLRAASLLLASTSLGARAGYTARDLMTEALALVSANDRPSRRRADIMQAAGVVLEDPSLRAVAEDMRRRLGLPGVAVRPPDSARLVDELPGRSVGLVRPAEVPADLVELQFGLIDNLDDITSGMGRVLTGRWPEGQQAPVGADTFLQSEDLFVHSLPWELAALPASWPDPVRWSWLTGSYRLLPAAAERIDVRWTQILLRALGADLQIDGIMGPLTREALRRAGVDNPTRAELRRLARLDPKSSIGKERGWVQIVRPKTGGSSRSVSSSDDYGFDVADHYARAGFEVTVTDELLPRSGYRGDPPAILHVSARLDYRTDGPYFEFAATSERPGHHEAKVSGSDLEPADVAQWLRRWPPETRPVVVLDPPHPGSAFDVPWQIVLRNRFAAAVFAEGEAPVVIGTGLQRLSGDYARAIGQGVREGLPLTAISRRLRGRMTRDQPAWHEIAGRTDDLAIQATAIFAAPSAMNDPESDE